MPVKKPKPLSIPAGVTVTIQDITGRELQVGNLVWCCKGGYQQYGIIEDIGFAVKPSGTYAEIQIRFRPEPLPDQQQLGDARCKLIESGLHRAPATGGPHQGNYIHRSYLLAAVEPPLLYFGPVRPQAAP